MPDKNESIIPDAMKRIPWKMIISILVAAGVLGGGGSMFITSDAVDEKIETKSVGIKKHVESTYVKIDPTFNEVKETINQVQVTQHAQISRQEARRITKSIDDREIREISYDRLVSMSMRRLKAKKEPCLNLDCSN